MSFLQQLQSKRGKLRTTPICITTAAGERFVETKEGMRQGVAEPTYGFVVDTKPDVLPACILEGFVYLGSQDAACPANIEQYKLTHILSIGVAPSSTIALTDVCNKFIACLDVPECNLWHKVLPESIEFMEQARLTNGRVLVHCNAGVSRSTAVVIGYLMEKQHMCYERAYEHVKSRRTQACPNTGFVQQLKKKPL